MRRLMEMIVRYPSPPIRASRRAKTVSWRQISITNTSSRSILLFISVWYSCSSSSPSWLRPGLICCIDARILPVTNVSAITMVCWFNQNLIMISIFVIICNWQPPVLQISKVEQKTLICLLNLSLFYQTYRDRISSVWGLGKSWGIISWDCFCPVLSCQ